MVEKKPVKISGSEWEVMEVLWKGSPDGLLLGQVVESLPAGKTWATKTIQTFLKRLTDKGAVEAMREGRMLRYSAAVSHADCVENEAGSFLERVFDGRVSSLVAHFLSDDRLDEAEVEELSRMLEERRG